MMKIRIHSCDGVVLLRQWWFNEKRKLHTLDFHLDIIFRLVELCNAQT